MEVVRNGTRHPTLGTTKTAKATVDPPDGDRPRSTAAATTSVKGTEDPPSGDPERRFERIRLECSLGDQAPTEIQQFCTYCDRYKHRAMVVTPSDQLPKLDMRRRWFRIEREIEREYFPRRLHPFGRSAKRHWCQTSWPGRSDIRNRRSFIQTFFGIPFLQSRGPDVE